MFFFHLLPVRLIDGAFIFDGTLKASWDDEGVKRNMRFLGL